MAPGILMEENPKVSVFMATFNHARFLRECLDSILNQTYQDFEIVIVNDGSTDGSHELLLDYQKRYSDKVFYYWHPGYVNKGVSASCNLAISKARGEYLAWIGSDDVWYPNKLESQIQLLQNHPQLGLVYSNAHFIDENGNQLPGLAGLDITHDPNPLGRMIQFCHVPTMTVVIRRDCLEDVGLFDETLIDGDWDLMIRIFARWEVGCVDEPLAKYRLHGKNISKGIDPKVFLKRILAMYQAVRDKATKIDGKFLLPRNRALLYLQLAFHHYCDGNEEEAIENLTAAFEEDPSINEDVIFINDWLNNWKEDFYNTTHSHFGFWVIAHLPIQIDDSFRNKLLELQSLQPDTRSFFIRRGIDLDLAGKFPITDLTIFHDLPDEIYLTKSWKNQVLREVYPALLFNNYKIGDLTRARHYWTKTVRLNPSWLKNRGVWAIGLKSLLAK
jgi:glycosyltransferase involved in cell wall biosynthesis